MNLPSALPDVSWSIAIGQENAQAAVQTTLILPVKDGVAVMVTNSLSGVRIDQWLAFTRFMVNMGTYVDTRLSFIDKATHLTDMMEIARKFTYAAYGIDIAMLNLPF